MSINLYEHNEAAYKAVVQMLGQYNKAAVIHPTGTGKSFIAFKLCADNTDKNICWLSPSEYIFKTQLENLKNASGGYIPENISFFTYAKLMNMTGKEIESIKPDYIVLDEFHRCGAEMWGQGVNTLLSTYPKVPVLGLSATAIRYLDNQRDMADELFDSNIASEMTLGEAIVRGILNPPKYVLSVFSYQKDLEKYEQRIRNSKNKIVRNEGEKYLDTLRRALDKADGMEEIFAKHITDKSGKYIVFCANFEHMHDMINLSKDWFCKIDKTPHIYSAYSNDSAASREFDSFKADNSNHLKLLYCIDMLNEGIHVDDISGVILLRPTVSPIIYKQQIGRALSANKKNNAVIFDIVFNIENLYSIGEIEDEMQIATAYYRALGEKNEIVNEHFKIVDEVHDCIELFNRLDNVLSASWDLMYDCAKIYYEEHGNLEVPARYFTKDGYALGSWIYNQRSIRKGTAEGVLTAEQINRLDNIGMRWDPYTDYTWTVNFNAAKEYYEIHGNLDVSSRYVTKDGIRLGSWLSNLRAWESSGVHPKYLTAERKKALEQIGMIWSKLNLYWENNYSAAVKYYRENGNLIVPSAYIDSDGVKLGAWISRLRKLHKGMLKRGNPPTSEQVERLNKIGMVWDFNVDRKWNDAYALAKEYFNKHSDLNVPSEYKCDNGFALGQWVKNQRRSYKKGTLNKGRTVLLNQIGMVWELTDGWKYRYDLVMQYYERNGNINISQKLIVDGVWLGKWLSVQKKLYREGEKLSKEQRALMEQLPYDKKPNNISLAWHKAYEDLIEYKNTYGTFQVAGDYRGKAGILLSDWIVRQRMAYKNGKLNETQIEMLTQIGFPWKLPGVWEAGYQHACGYYEKHGNLIVKKNYRCDDGYALGVWIFNYRNAHNQKKSPVSITREQTKLLEEIGMEWNPPSVWDLRYAETVDFHTKNHRKRLSAKKLKALADIGMKEISV